MPLAAEDVSQFSYGPSDVISRIDVADTHISLSLTTYLNRFVKEKNMLISAQKIMLRPQDLLRSCFTFSGSKNLKFFRSYLPAGNISWIGSGREALRQILSQVDGEKVGMPAFTCRVVLDAVKRAGKIPIFYDSGVIAEISEIKKIIDDVDVLLVCHNFGFIPEMDKIADLCQKHKVILVEDCAQALGARYKGKLAGSFGDYAFYSFGISKNISFCGGMFVTKFFFTDKKLNMNNQNNYLPKYPFSKLLSVISKVLISPLFFNKYFYGFNRRFLQGELDKEQEALSYECPGFAKNVIIRQSQRYSKILMKRKRNAEYCLKNLSNAVKVINPIKESAPAWLYFTVIVENRNKILKHLLNNGVELTVMKTFRCFDEKSRKALEAEQKHLVFALYRDFSEVKRLVKIINKTLKNFEKQID